MSRNPDYFDFDHMISFGKTFNMIVNERDTGKTYGTKKAIVEHAIKTQGKEVFLWLWRYKDDMVFLDNFFDRHNADGCFEGYTIKRQGRKWISVQNEEDCEEGAEPIKFVVGYSYFLSNWQTFKTTGVVIKFIVYDEFIKQADNRRYLPKEPIALLNMQDSIDRAVGVKPIVICLGNNVTPYNPFFVEFGIRLTGRENKVIKGDVLLYMFTPKNQREKRSKRSITKTAEGTSYKYGADNKWMEYSEAMIRKKTDPNANLVFVIKYQGVHYGCWQCRKDGFHAFDKTYNLTCPYKFVIDVDELEDGYMLLLNKSTHPYGGYLCFMFERTMLYVDDGNTRQALFEILGRLGHYV